MLNSASQGSHCHRFQHFQLRALQRFAGENIVISFFFEQNFIGKHRKSNLSSLCTLPKSWEWADSHQSTLAWGNPTNTLPVWNTAARHSAQTHSLTHTQQRNKFLHVGEKKQATQAHQTQAQQTHVRTNTFLPLTKTSVLQTRWKEDAGAKILKHHVLLRPQRASLAIRGKEQNGTKTKRNWFRFFFSFLNT